MPLTKLTDDFADMLIPSSPGFLTPCYHEYLLTRGLPCEADQNLLSLDSYTEQMYNNNGHQGIPYPYLSHIVQSG